MTDLPWFRCFPDRLLSALGEMDATTQHVYVVVLLKIYARSGPIKDNLQALATFCRRGPQAVETALENLVGMGRLTRADGFISNAVAEAELGHQRSVSLARSNSGKRGGLKSGLARAAKSEENQGAGEANASHGRTDKTRLDKTREEKNPPKAPQGGLPLSNGNGADHHPADDYPANAFETWYAGYPHKVAKDTARRTFEKLQAAHRVTFAELVEGRDRYIRDKPADISWAHPASWLNAGRWKDQPATGPPPASGAQRKSVYVP